MRTWKAGRKRKLLEIGSKWGKWTVLENHHADKRGQSACLCRCACGTEKIITNGNLKNCITQQCFNCAKKRNKHKY